MGKYLTEEQLKFWDENGYLVLTDYFTPEQVEDLNSWVEDLESRPETPGKWMKYFETPANDPTGRQLCRVENFLQYHEGFAGLLEGERVIGILSELMGEQAVLFKEKINFKLPGGSGFTAHQDAPAFTTFNQQYHITMMVSIDASNPENGCLEMVPGRHKEGLLHTAPDGTIDLEFADTLTWIPLPTQAGDMVFFDSYIPHRSHANVSDRPRRACYITYNKASEGSHREDYYRHKREVFPPDVERIPGKEYGDPGVYNVGNPIKS